MEDSLHCHANLRFQYSLVHSRHLTSRDVSKKYPREEQENDAKGITGIVIQGITATINASPHQSQEEMSEIAKVDTEDSLSSILFKDKL